MGTCKSAELLILNDFMTTPITTLSSIDLFEIMETFKGHRATIIASQLEPNEWRLRIEGELMADPILNRLATGALYLDLKGPNMRGCFAKRKEAVWRYQIQLTHGTVFC